MQHLIRRIKKYYKHLLILNLLLLFFIIYETLFSKYYWEGKEEKSFTIAPGKNLDEIIDELRQQDILLNPFLFKLVVKLSGKENQIISRSYLFKNGMSNLNLLDQLTDKDNYLLVRITFPPGYTIKRMGQLLEKKLSLSKEKFIAEAENDSLINLLGLKGQVKNLEGFLFPDTYDVSPVISEREILFILFNEFRKKVINNREIQNLITQNGTTLLKTMTLASIIEGETRLDEEKPVIAGVYLNRINKGMKLEADPTIQFILPDGPKPRLLFEDLKINSPYNTYMYKGLPPAPINNPGISSIMAVLKPAKHNYLFFVATGEGGHKFTENYQEHLKAVQEYKKKLKSDANNKK